MARARRRLAALLTLFAASCGGEADAVDASASWPAWRGPLGTGMARGGGPLHWSDTEGVRWRAELPGRGSSTPIVVGENVFVTTAVPGGPGALDGGTGEFEEQAFALLCLDRADGSLRWRRDLRRGVPHEGFNRNFGSWASASPVSDGRNVWVSFGSHGLYCVDLDGRPVWEHDPEVRMRMRRGYGEGSTPALHGDTLVQVFDHEGASFLAAYDARTGAERWRTPRDEATTYAQPLVVEHDGRAQVVTSGEEFLRAYDLATGALVWECSGLGHNAIPSPVRHGDLVLAMTGYLNPKLMAVRLGGRGVLGPADVAWSTVRGCARVATPVLDEGLLYVVDDRGLLSCFDAGSGTPHYLERRFARGMSVKASPVGADGRLYVATDAGDVHVVSMGADGGKLLATNAHPGQTFVASPALADGELYLRAPDLLYCITGSESPPEPPPEPAATVEPAPEEPAPPWPAGPWLRGNLHAHTTRCDHADSSPEEVVRWYHDAGYDFLSLTEHDQFIDPTSLAFDSPLRDDFVLIRGAELNYPALVYPDLVHVRLMSLGGLNFKPEPSGPGRGVQLQDFVRDIWIGGGIPVLSHPNYLWAIAPEDVPPLVGLFLFELYNGARDPEYHGGGEHPTSEELWDTWLTAGCSLYGLAGDDAHRYDPGRKIQTPGRGWVMVKAEERAPRAILDALHRGHFYSSNGVHLEDVVIGDDTYEVRIDPEATRREVERGRLVPRLATDGEPGFLIEFIGPGGTVSSARPGLSAAHPLPSGGAYLRCRVTYRWETEAGLAECHAWTQPVFEDDRPAPPTR